MLMVYTTPIYSIKQHGTLLLCRAMVKEKLVSTSTSVLNLRGFVFCLTVLQIVMTYLTFQNKHNICTLSANINLICARFKKGEKSSRQRIIFLVSKARTNRFFFTIQCMYILYIQNNNIHHVFRLYISLASFFLIVDTFSTFSF